MLLALIGCNVRKNKVVTPITPIATMPSPIKQILPTDNGIYVLLLAPSVDDSLFFVTNNGAIRPLKLIDPSITHIFTTMFAILDHQRFVLLCPEINRIECRDYSGKLDWYYESLYTKWKIGSLRRGHAFIAANNKTVVLYTRVSDIVKLIWLNGSDGKIIKIMSPSIFNNNKLSNIFGLGMCTGMQLDDDGNLFIAFDSVVFYIDKTTKNVGAIKFSQPIAGLYKSDKVFVAVMKKNEIIDLFSIQTNNKVHFAMRIIFKRQSGKLMGIDKDNCYFMFGTNDIWRARRKKLMLIL